MTKLKIYKASAGSGKTTLLTESYIRLLAEEGIDAYRSVLAVTFTNKAADEMKNRIIDILYNVAVGEKTFEGISAERAGQLLEAMLNDYSRFNVSTIDSFFQKVLRSFVHELGLRDSYVLQLDTEQALNDSVHDLLLQLDKDENEDVLEWAERELENTLNDNKKWKDMVDSLKTLGLELFKEVYQNNSAELSDKDAIAECLKTARRIKKEFDDGLPEKAGEACKIIDGLDPKLRDAINVNVRRKLVSLKERKVEIKGNKEKELTQTLIDKIKDKNVCKKEKNADLCQTELKNAKFYDILKGLLRFYDDRILDYMTARAALSFLPSLVMLNRLDLFIKEKMRDENSLLISESTKAINAIVGDCDTPFIYEKVGSRLKHYFLDEFQDTSLLQWDNFRPLIKESLDSGYPNLVVGDVKQSIYRFRNSNWKILGEQIESQFPENADINTLDTNYRSGREIIEFNNGFFSEAAAVLQGYANENAAAAADPEFRDRWQAENSDVLIKAYADVAQKVPEREPKASRVELVPIIKNDKDGWKEKAFERTKKRIDELVEAGFAYSDMAVLCYKGEDCSACAKYLISQGVNVISGESLLVDSSEKVRLLLCLLKYIDNPDDKINLFLLHRTYPDFENRLAGLKRAASLPFYQMLRELYDLFEADKEGEEAYVQAFFDEALRFSLDRGAVIADFLELWDEKKDKLYVPSPAAGNAVTIMTVHKAKGLAYPIVFMPVCDWNLFKESNNYATRIKWCKTSAPFDQIPYLPLEISHSKMVPTKFAADYFDEMLNSYMDAFNLLYVAYTRPRRLLFACFPVEIKQRDPALVSDEGEFLSAEAITAPTDYKSVSDLIQAYVAKRAGESAFEDGAVCFGGGSLSPGDTGWVKAAEGTDQPLSGGFAHLPFSAYRLRGGRDLNFMRERGNLLHAVMAKIDRASDLDSVIDEMVRQGRIDLELSAEIKAELKPYVNNPEVAEWFDGSGRGLNERDIIIPGDRPDRRPDRILLRNGETIVIDYKFGEPEPKHQTQVADYVNLLREAGFSDVSGWLYYFKNLERLEVGGKGLGTRV